MFLVKTAKDYVRWYRYWGTAPVRNWVKAAELFRESRFTEAAVEYQQGLDKRASHPAAQSARFDMAYCFYRVDKFDDALEILEGLLNSRTKLKECYLLYARIKSCLGFLVTARDTLAACSEIYSDCPQVISCYARAAIQVGLGAEEVIGLRRRLQRLKLAMDIDDPLNLHVETSLAHLEIRCGDLRKGERLLARVLSTGQAPYEAVLLRGERLLEQSRVLPAREQLSRAMRAAPKDPHSVILLARSYLRAGPSFNLSYALQLSKLACQLSAWQNAEALSVLVRAYEEQGDEAYAQLFMERIKQVPSARELDVSYFLGSLQQLRAQKTSNS